MSALWSWSPIVAHRCGGRLAPENSIEGLHRAAEAGIVAVEFDVMLAQCGTPVVIHDETLERTTDGKGEVARTPWDRLKALRLRDAHGRLTRHTLPCFEDVLLTCARLGLAANIEIKPSSGMAAATGRHVAALTRQLIRHHPMPVLLTSFERSALDAAMSEAPELAYGHLFDGDAQEAMDTGDLSGYSQLVFNARRVTEASVRQAMKCGYGVAVYTVNDVAEARRMRAWGVAGVISDEPKHLADALGDGSLA